MQLMLISTMVFITVVGLIIGIYLLQSEKQQQLTDRLINMITSSKDDSPENGKKQAKLELNKLLSAMGKNFTNFSFTKNLEIQLDKADILLRTDEYIGLNIVTTFSGGFIGLALFSARIDIVILFAFVGAILPGLLVYRQKLKRAALLNEEIGETLTGMSNSLRAGYSFQQAMDLVSKESSGPLAKEYRRTLREINLGITTEQALMNLIVRTENEDMELMISSVLIQRQIGGNLAEIFDKIADTIRQRIRMKGEIKVLTAQGRISSWIIGLMPVFLLIVIWMLNPTYISMFFETTLGWVLLAGAAVSEFIGFMLIRKITTIEF